MNLILRTVASPYGDTTLGSVLSQQDVDNNFINLKGELIYTASTSSNNSRLSDSRRSNTTPQTLCSTVGSRALLMIPCRHKLPVVLLLVVLMIVTLVYLL